MMKKLRGLFRIIFGRTAFVILFMAIQLGILFGVFRWLEDYVHIIYVVSILLSAVVIIYIFNEPINSSFKMAWIVPVLVIPVFGVLLYIFVQMQFQTKLLARRLKNTIKSAAPYLNQAMAVQEKIYYLYYQSLEEFLPLFYFQKSMRFQVQLPRVVICNEFLFHLI